MEEKVAITKNLKRILAAARSLIDRPLGVQGMGVLWGYTGEGKSESMEFVRNAVDGVYIRLKNDWTAARMLGALLYELGLPPCRSRGEMIDQAIDELMRNPRPIFVDEADYLFRKPGAIDTWRDIYDDTRVPVFLAGEEKLKQKLENMDNGKYARRVSEWIKFDGIDMADARIVADTVCEVKITDDLLHKLYRQAKANIGHMKPGLAHIEAFAKTNCMDTVSLKDWGRRSLLDSPPKSRREV